MDKTRHLRISSGRFGNTDQHFSLFSNILKTKHLLIKPYITVICSELKGMCDCGITGQLSWVIVIFYTLWIYSKIVVVNVQKYTPFVSEMDGCFFPSWLHLSHQKTKPLLDSRCLSLKPSLHLVLSFSLLQITFMCTCLAALMHRPAQPCVTAPVKEPVTPG